MESKILWNNLENTSTKDIKIMVIATIVYLVKDRQMNLKEFIKDIKNIIKKRGVIGYE